MYCSNCGAQVNENAVVCIKCGCAVNGGHMGTAIIQLLTCGGCGIWALIDFITVLPWAASRMTKARP